MTPLGTQRGPHLLVQGYRCQLPRLLVCSALSFCIGTSSYSKLHFPKALINRSRREHEKLPESVGGVKAFGQKTHGVHWRCHFKFRPRLMYPNHDGTFAPMRIWLLLEKAGTTRTDLSKLLRLGCSPPGARPGAQAPVALAVPRLAAPGPGGPGPAGVARRGALSMHPAG